MNAMLDVSYLREYELPWLARLSNSLHAACFPLMKLMPARFMLERAAADGRLRPKTQVVETTSGTFGLALAMLCAVRGYRLHLVSDPAIDQRLARRLADLGTTLDILNTPDGKGYQGARMARLQSILEEQPDAFWPCQYHNPDNPKSYARLAELLVRKLGRIDCLVGSVGSGGSMCGTSRFLRELFPEMRAIGIDTHGSVLFGHCDNKRALRGLGNSLMPKNVDHAIFDEVHWIDGPLAFQATRRLHQRSAVFMGGTSGATYLVAAWYVRRHPDQTVVALFPDEGHRYWDTIYDDEWLKSQPGWPPEPVSEPRDLEFIEPASTSGWTSLRWARRSLADVLQHSPKN